MDTENTADRYVNKLRGLVEKVESSQYALTPDQELTAEQMAAVAEQFASAFTLLDSTLMNGRELLPADWRRKEPPPSQPGTDVTRTTRGGDR